MSRNDGCRWYAPKWSLEVVLPSTREWLNLEGKEARAAKKEAAERTSENVANDSTPSKGASKAASKSAPAKKAASESSTTTSTTTEKVEEAAGLTTNQTDDGVLNSQYSNTVNTKKENND